MSRQKINSRMKHYSSDDAEFIKYLDNKRMLTYSSGIGLPLRKGHV